MVPQDKLHEITSKFESRTSPLMREVVQTARTATTAREKEQTLRQASLHDVDVRAPTFRALAVVLTEASTALLLGFRTFRPVPCSV